MRSLKSSKLEKFEVGNFQSWKTLKLEKYEVGKVRSWKSTKLEKFEVTKVHKHAYKQEGIELYNAII